jgi:hypothetical protein
MASYSPASDAITCVTRGSRARAIRSSRSSSETFSASLNAATGSLGEYNTCVPPSLSSSATADWPCRPMARVAVAALVSASRLMSSEYANAVFSPDTARTPTPRSIENDPDLTMPSSRLQLSIREYWK